MDDNLFQYKFDKMDDISPKELHRLRQRFQYHHMLQNLNFLNMILPSLSSPFMRLDKPQTKQHIIMESIQYIEYLQLCIYELSKRAGDSKTIFIQEQKINQTVFLDTTSSENTQSPFLFNRFLSTNGSVPIMYGNENNSSLSLCANSPSCYHAETINQEEMIINKENRKRTAKPILQNEKKQKIKKAPKKYKTKKKIFASPSMKAFHKSGTSGSVIRLAKSMMVQGSPKFSVQFLSPPNSYKRTIIEESPKTCTKFLWKTVSVKTKEPWMPRPEEEQTSSMEKVIPNSDQDASTNINNTSLLPDGFVDNSDEDDWVSMLKNTSSVIKNDVKESAVNQIQTVNTNTSLIPKKHLPMHLTHHTPEIKKLSPRAFLTKATLKQ